MPSERTDRSVYRVDLEAMDPLLFGDNRPARAGFDHLQLDQDPSPLTLHGAIGRHLADRLPGDWPEDWLGEQVPDILQPTSEVASLLGYCLRAADGRLLFPAPLHLRCRKSSRGSIEAAELLAPREAQSAASSCPQPRLLHSTTDIDHEHEGRLLLSETALENVLCGRLPVAGLVEEDEAFRREARPGIEVDNRSGNVVEGRFFTRPYRRFHPAPLDPAVDRLAGFCTWFETLARLPTDVVQMTKPGFLAGDRRRVRLSFVVEEPLRRLRESVEASARETPGGIYLYLLTPGLSAGEPPSFPGSGAELECVAAAVGKARWVSGWNTARRRPRPIVALQPAGSVYFFTWPPGIDAEQKAAIVRNAWMRPAWVAGAAAGFGRGLAGVWG